MTANHSSLLQPSRLRTASVQDPAAKRARASAGRRKERKRALFAAVTLALLIAGLVGGYSAHVQMSEAAAARLAERNRQAALEKEAALRTGPVLFTPQDGNVCRRRVIDNETWTIRDGGAIQCDDTVYTTLPGPQYQIGRRLDAIRNVFQQRGTGKPE